MMKRNFFLHIWYVQTNAGWLAQAGARGNNMHDRLVHDTCLNPACSGKGNREKVVHTSRISCIVYLISLTQYVFGAEVLDIIVCTVPWDSITGKWHNNIYLGEGKWILTDPQKSCLQTAARVSRAAPEDAMQRTHLYHPFPVVCTSWKSCKSQVMWFCKCLGPICWDKGTVGPFLWRVEVNAGPAWDGHRTMGCWSEFEGQRMKRRCRTNPWVSIERVKPVQTRGEKV